MSLQMFARLLKVDAATRRVTGVIADETPDRSREVFDYASSKENFEKWSGEFSKATDGKSLGNVRAMHGNVAAGRLTEITFDDVQKNIVVEADIVDDQEWDKVTKGLYTGFSIGGKYVKKWTDTEGHKRYTADPHEVSLVDLPCNKTATFTMVKGEGIEAEQAFDETVATAEADPAVTQEVEPEVVKAATPDEPVEGELRLNDESNTVEKYVGGKWASLGVLTPVEDESLTKGCYAIGQLARLAEDVAGFITYRTYESWDGKTAGTVPAELKAAAISLYDGLVAIVAEDAEKAKGMIAEKLAKANEEDALRKAAHENELGVVSDLQKLAVALGVEEVGGVLTAIETLAKSHAEQSVELTDLRKKVEGAPVPAKGVLKTVEKAADNSLEPAADASTTVTASEDVAPDGLNKGVLRDALRKGVVMRGLGA